VRLDGSDPKAVERAAALLAAGELVAFPTETVYGLGARADDDAAVAGIFRAKGRPADHPLIVHVGSAVEARKFAAHLPPVALRLMAAFWPGPLTLIVPRAPGIAFAAAGGQGSVGLRSPSHPVAQALLAAARRRGVAGIAGPSANRFGRVSPTLAAHVESEFGSALAVLDGGPCSVGIESSIVDCSRSRPVLLRPGVLTRACIEAAAGEPLHEPDADAPRAPGTLQSHYAPSAKVRLMSRPALAEALRALERDAPRLAVYSRGAALPLEPPVLQRSMPALPEQAARELFSVLRDFDAEGAQLIWVEEPPPGPEWDGVRDRLQRAAAS
jgi:L-threonylcarbamoyladenylate synthase